MPLCFFDQYVHVNAAATTTIGPICFKCGSTKKSRKLSCCARGGSWFKNCGDNGDSKFEHTWVEGVQACKKTRLTECKDINDRADLRVFACSPRLLFFIDKCLYVHTSSHNDNRNANPFDMLQVRHHQEKRETQLLCSWWFLVQELWRLWRLKV